MRLHHLSVNEFRSLGGVTVEMDGLVVLVGANSSGKSTILDAIRGVVRGVGSLRESPYGEDTGDPWVDADLLLELTASGLAGHADSELHRRLLAGECGDGLWLAPHDGLHDLLADEALSSVQDLLATAYAEEAGPGDPNDRHLLADWMFASRFFVVADDQTWILVTSDGLPAEAAGAAARIAASAADDEDDGLACDAIDLVGGTPATIPIAAGHATGDWLVPHAPVVDVNAELDRLHDEVRDAIDAIDTLLWSDPEPPPGNEPTHRRGAFVLGVGNLAPDLWIEGQAEPQSLFWARDEVGDPESAMQWRRVRPSLVATAAVLEARANAIAPSFVTESGTIRLYLLPPTYWQSEPSRVRIAFDQGGLRDLTRIGAGTARWVAASIRLAIHELRTATRQICDESGAPIESREAARDAIEAAREDPLNQRALRLDPTSLAPALYLIDEPEAHLHPTAMRSVIRWLRDVSERGHSAIIATHNPALVSQLSPHATVYLVRGDGTTTTVTDVSDDVVGELTRLAADFGLTPGDLLLMTRMALFVEGPHDVAVLDAIGGDELALAGVRIFPLHGVRNTLALVDSEIIAALGIRLAVLTDHTDRERLRTAQPQSSEERASLRLLREARASGRRISPFGLTKPDIVMYLDDQACRAQADRFPGWEEADRAWRASDRSLDLKSFVAAKYGLHLTRDVVYQLAIATRLAARVPHELRACIQAIGAGAQDDSGVPPTL